MTIVRSIGIAVGLVALSLLRADTACLGEDGYEFWLRYRPVADVGLLARYRAICRSVVLTESTPILESATHELLRGLAMLLEQKVATGNEVVRDGTILLGTGASKLVRDTVPASDLRELGPEGYVIRSGSVGGKPCTVIAGGGESGVLYGAFHLLRLLQTWQPVDHLQVRERPSNPLRLVNHWDTPFGGPPKREYQLPSVFDWERLPQVDARLRDYGRMLASVGINGCVPNSPGGGSGGCRLLQTANVGKVAALATALRAYGVRLYLSASFASPVLVGGLQSADPLDPAVAGWWADKADELYRQIPDLGGFLVKADSEGAPGPAEYHRSAADGANMLARALATHGGVVIWRAFVYGRKDLNPDRAAQAYEVFKPLDGHFADNVILQIKNGPLDFQVREPVSPLLGAMPKTNQVLELQIKQEYTGRVTHLCYLVPQWKEVLEFDTKAAGDGAAVKRIINGAVFGHRRCGIAGVSNIGADRNWTRHYLAQANMHGFGRLAWNPDLSAEQIADEWVTMSFGHDPTVVRTVSHMLLGSWRTYENYTSPLGVGVMAQAGNHYEPAPQSRVRYHRADTSGVGFDRTVQTGSGYTTQYAAPVGSMYEDLETCPDELVLFFHHVPYTHRLKSGKTVIQHIYDTHFEGVEQVEAMRDAWAVLRGTIDEERHEHVLERLDAQLEHARRWRDEITGYFFGLSGIADEEGRLGR